MLKVFEELRKNFKLRAQIYSIDNLVFKLHYRVTALMLLVATILVCSRQYIGEHIACISDNGVPQHVINTYCFFTPTFTVIKQLDSALLDSGYLAHPGVGPFGLLSDEPVKRHNYYQWVPFVLFTQALMFCVPHLLWKRIEGGRLSQLVDGLQFASLSLSNDKEFQIQGRTIPTKEHTENKVAKIREAFMQRIIINRSWSRGLILCEILNALQIVLQMYLTDMFLGGQFFQLGLKIIDEGLDASVDVLDIVFPKVTKCTFHKYGPSGSIQAHDAMCVMALNIINDKIYVFLWFWFIFLFALTMLGLFWRLLTVILHARSRKFNELVFAAACPGKLNPWRVLRVTQHCNFTDWLFLYYLSKNMDGYVFKELFIGLARELDAQDGAPLISNADIEIAKEA